MAERSDGRASRERLVALLKERKPVQGVAVDNAASEVHGATRNRDDAFWLRTPDFYHHSHLLTVSTPDVSAVVPKGSALDNFALKGGRSRPLFPDEVLDRDLTLKSGVQRPTVSISIPLMGDFHGRGINVTAEPTVQLTRLQLERSGKLTHHDVADILKDKTHKMYSFFQQCEEVASILRRQRSPDTSLGKDPNLKASTMIVEEFMTLVNSSMTSYFAERGARGIFKKKKDGISFYTPFYEEGNFLKITAPMRRYDALVNQRVLKAISRGEKSPYSLRELNDICRFLNEQELPPEELSKMYDGASMVVYRRRRMNEGEKRELAERVNSEAAKVEASRRGASDARKKERIIKQRLREHLWKEPPQRAVVAARRAVVPYGERVPGRERRNKRQAEVVFDASTSRRHEGPKIVHIGQLNGIPDGTTVTIDMLINLGLVPPEARETGIKLHADGKLKRRLEIVGIPLTKRAVAKVEGAGGQLSDIPPSPRALRKTARVKDALNPDGYIRVKVHPQAT